MHAHATPSGTRTMWTARVNAIWERAHGTGSTASRAGSTVTMPGYSSGSSVPVSSYRRRCLRAPKKATTQSRATKKKMPIPTKYMRPSLDGCGRHFDLPGLRGGFERRVVAFVLVRVRRREGGDCAVEGVVGAEVGRDGDAVPRTGVTARGHT